MWIGEVQPFAQMAVFLGPSVCIPEVQPFAQMAVFISLPAMGRVFWDAVIPHYEIHHGCLCLCRIQPFAQMAVFLGPSVCIPEIQPFAQMAVFISLPAMGRVFWDAVIPHYKIHHGCFCLYRIQPFAQMAVFLGPSVCIPEIQPFAQMAVFISLPAMGRVFWDAVIPHYKIHHGCFCLYRIQPFAQMAVFLGPSVCIPEIQPFAQMAVFLGALGLYPRNTAICTKGCTTDSLVFN